MGSRAVSSWQHFIQLVDQIPQAADPISLFDRMLLCKNTELDNLPPCSPAEWEALVLKKKIPLHLCKSLVRAVRHFGSSSSCCLASDDGLTTTWDHKIENMLRFTSIALMLLTNNAIKLAARQAASESCGSAAAGVPERVTAGFVQQLERSEMLLSLPEMLDMAAETLTRYSFQMVSGKLDCAVSFGDRLDAAAAGGAAAAAGAGGAAAAVQQPQQAAALQETLVVDLARMHAQRLLAVCSYIIALCPNPSDTVSILPDEGASAVMLCHAALYHVSVCVQQLSSKGFTPPKDLLALANIAQGVFDLVSKHVVEAGGVLQLSASKPQVVELVTTPGYLECVLYSLVVSQQALAMRQQRDVGSTVPAATAATATAGSSSSSGETSGRTHGASAAPTAVLQVGSAGALLLLQAAAAAGAAAAAEARREASDTSWQQACRLHAAEEGNFVATLATQLLEPLGFDRRAVLWAAVSRSQDGTWYDGLPTNVLLVYQDMLSLRCEEWRSRAAQLQRQLQQPGKEQEVAAASQQQQQQQEPPQQQHEGRKNRDAAVQQRQQRQQQQQQQQQQDDQFDRAWLMNDFPTHLIAASVMLQYLTTPPSTQHSVLWLKCCLVAVECARSMTAACHEMRPWVRQEFEERQQHQQHQQQQAGSTQPQQEEQPCPSYAKGIPSQWLGEVLPAIPKVMLQLVEHLARRDWTADTGSGKGSSRASSDNASSSSSEAAAARLVDADDAGPPEVLGDHVHHNTLLVCFGKFLSLVSCLGEHSIAVPHSSAAGDVTLSFQGRDAWLGSAPALLAALEAFVRAAAAINTSAEGIFSAQIAGAIKHVVQLCGGGDTPTVLLACAVFTPHGSKARQQLMSLFSSVLKAVASLQVDKRSVEATIKRYMGFMDAALWLVASPNLGGNGVLGDVGDTAGEVGATTATAPASTASDPRHIQCILFGFNLLGRCSWGVFHLARAVMAFSDSAGDAPAAAATGQDEDSVPGQGDSTAIMLASMVGRYASRFNRLLLEEDGTNGFMQWLSCKGYDDTGLQQLLQQTGTALGPMRVEDPACSAEAVLRLLQQLGDAASSLAFARVCNNPGCVNLSGPSETILVSGRSCMCAACGVAHYCCRQCQKSHWKQHKPVCKALVAATAAS